MIRFWFLLHRYVGIAIGLVLLLWTLSGIVMMYKQYPELNELEKLNLLDKLNFQSCCQTSFVQSLTLSYKAARLEMLAAGPIMKLVTEDDRTLVFDLIDGRRLEAVDRIRAEQIAEQFIESGQSNAQTIFEGTIYNDQWTVYGAYNPHRPLHKFAIDDDAGTEFYISSLSGEIVQLTTSEQRFWAYLGAVIHWLYPTQLRENTALWAQVVIWLTIVSIFLVSTGLYIGYRQFKRRRSGRLSPYRGAALFHHYTGLIFGILILSWVSSGLLSMNPWGLLESEGPGPESRRLAQRLLQADEIDSLLNRSAFEELNGTTVRLELTTLANEPSLIAFQKDGSSQRLQLESMQPQPLSSQELSALAVTLRPTATVLSEQLLDKPDSYYYQHHEAREFPIYRVVLDDKQQTRYYLSPVSGEIVVKIDSNQRLYRWLFYGLHRGDFNVLLRSRPIWDSFMLLFLLGGTVLCGTGCWLAIRRLRRSISFRPVTVATPLKRSLPATVD